MAPVLKNNHLANSTPCTIIISFCIKLTGILEKKLKGAVVSACFSQNKEELIIQFETSVIPFLIKASLLPTFSCLSFPENFNRARINSADLFGDLIGQRVTGVHQYKNERCFTIQFTNRFSLLFKLHGNRSNILLFKDDVKQGIFKNSIKGDFGTTLKDLDREIDWSFETFVKEKNNLQKIYFTFGHVVWRYLTELGFHNHTTERAVETNSGSSPSSGESRHYVAEIHHRLTFSLLPVGKTIRQFQDPLKAMNDFFISYTHSDTFAAESICFDSIGKETPGGKEIILKRQRQNPHPSNGQQL